MAPVPPLTPTTPESTGARVPVRTRSDIPDETLRESTANLIFVKLRKMIASDTHPTESILGTIAVAAQSLTGATGAAVAMPRDGQVVCVGRSGETAPELGDRLNVDSGISGECLRTGVTMRCDDASRDLHADAEVCRQLGLKSIAVVPLRGQYGRVGVLEAFSTESYAFNEDKIQTLERLAGLAEAAWARGLATSTASGEAVEPASEPATLVEVPAEQPPSVAVAAEVQLAQVREALGAVQPDESSRRKMWIYTTFATAAVLALALLAVYGWKAWYTSSLASKSSRPGATAQVGAGGTEPSSAPEIAGTSAPTGESQATLVAKPTVAINDKRPHRRSRGIDRRSAKDGAKSASIPTNDDVPQVAASSANPAAIETALVAPPALPRLTTAISQGIAGGVLTHKVKPVYPAEARRLRVQGNVVIDATVTAEGQVGELKLVSGDPMLSAAALDAVRQWRYTPYTLNGKPIPKPTRITISFIAPQ
jgi:TonB family protein